jgi:hypothetical protein
MYDDVESRFFQMVALFTIKLHSLMVKMCTVEQSYWQFKI